MSSMEARAGVQWMSGEKGSIFAFWRNVVCVCIEKDTSSQNRTHVIKIMRTHLATGSGTGHGLFDAPAGPRLGCSTIQIADTTSQKQVPLQLPAEGVLVCRVAGFHRAASMVVGRASCCGFFQVPGCLGWVNWGFQPTVISGASERIFSESGGMCIWWLLRKSRQ